MATNPWVDVRGDVAEVTALVEAQYLLAGDYSRHNRRFTGDLAVITCQ